MNDSYIPILEARVEETQNVLARLQAEHEKLKAEHELYVRVRAPFWSEMHGSSLDAKDFCVYGTHVYRIAHVYKDGSKWRFTFEHNHFKPVVDIASDTREEAMKHVEDYMENYYAIHNSPLGGMLSR
jgi:hypothetical protein